MSEYKFRWSPERRKVTIGKVYAVLLEDGQISIGRTDGLVDTKIAKLDKSEIQDLLVALDGIQGDQPDPEPRELRDAIILGAHELARDIYKRTARRAVVDVNLHPDVFFRIAADEHGRIGRTDYERGHVRVADDVELSLDRSAK